MGYKRNLKCEEIINANKEDKSFTTSILLTGMGEPLLNYEEVVKFHKKASEKIEINEFILSTSGIADKIKEKLVKKGFKVKISQGNGRDISAACGQLFV